LARIAGVDLPLNKRVQIGLTYIFGIGKSRATKICQEAKIDLNTKVKNLTEEEAVMIRNRLLPRAAPSAWSARPWAENPYQCAHSQGATARGGQEVTLQ
jgi:hypothetical protein